MGSSPAPDGVTRRGPRRRVGRGALPLAFLVSAVLHVAVFSLRFGAPALDPGAAVEPRAGEAEGRRPIRAYNVIVTETDAPSPFVEPAAEPNREEDRTTTPPRTLRTAPEVTGGRRSAPTRRSSVERLTPRVGDPRLWEGVSSALPPDPDDVDPMTGVRGRVLGRIGVHDDSAAAEAEAARRTTDWTHTDARGRRFGISPGKIHLGRITIPLCSGIENPADCGLGVSAGRRDEYNDRLQTFREIQWQAGRANLKEQIEAIRARKDAEREAERKRRRPDR